MNLVEWDLRCNMVPLHVVHMGTLFKNEFSNKTTTGCSDSDHNHDVLCDHLTPIQSRFDGISTRSDRMIHDMGHSARFEAFANFCCRLKSELQTVGCTHDRNWWSGLESTPYGRKHMLLFCCIPNGAFVIKLIWVCKHYQNQVWASNVSVKTDRVTIRAFTTPLLTLIINA